MFKKIEIWVLYLTILCLILFAIFFGVLVRQELVGTVKMGKISKAALFLSEIPMNIKKILHVAKDPGVDLGVGKRFKDKDGFVGSFKQKNYFLLLSRYDGDISESVVELINLEDQKVIHRWNPDIKYINSLIDQKREEYLLLERDFHENRFKIYSPLITNDGGLVFHANGSALIKIDACNKLKWINDVDHFHHSNEVDSNENYWVPSRIFPYSLDKKKIGSKYGDFFDDAITKVSKEGKILFQKSVSQILIENKLEHLVFSDYVFHGDPIHLNDIQPVEEDARYWKKGDLFLSLRSQNMIILYRPSTNKIISSITGPFSNQHDVDIISDKEISIFNNNIYFYKGERINNARIHFLGDPDTGNIEILIYNFETKKFNKKFSKGINENNVRTSVAGLSEILDDGSLFIEETQSGRILFFDKKGELILEYINKAKNGTNYGLGFSRVLKMDNRLRNQIKSIKSKSCIN